MEASVGRERRKGNNPPGGIAAWVRNSPLVRYPDLGLICIGIFIMLVGVGAVVPVRAIYARNEGATLEEIGFMASSFLLGQLLFQLPGGWASDRWGRKPIMVAGVAIGGMISFLFLLNDAPWYFIALRFVEGISSGVVAPAANAYVIDTVPEKERGVAFGWLGSAFSAGFMMGPAIGGPMSDWLGYASPFIFGGVTSMITAAFLLFKMSNIRPGAINKAALPIEDIATTVPITVEQEKRERRIPKSLFVPALIGSMAFTIAAGFGDGLFISIWSIWLNDLHASNSYIGLTFVIFSLPLMLFMPTTGKWADKGRLALLIAVPYTLVSSVYYVYAQTTDLFLIAAMGALEGTCLAISIPALSAFIADLSPDNARGKLQGIFSTVRTIAAFGSSIATALLYKGSIEAPFLALAITQITISLVGGVVVYVVERRSRRTRGV
jgi:DHA1 family multidrug resistance protein-like MFS transporter